MWLLRAITHVVLALALITVGAQAQPMGFLPNAAPHHHEYHDGAAGHMVAAHDHSDAGKNTPAHERHSCQAACCYAPAQPLARAGEVSPVQFFSAIRYDDVAASETGRSDAPEPGIPKHLT